MDFQNEAEKQKEYISLLKERFEKEYQKTGHRKTYCCVTFGCQMNARDSEKLCGILEAIGYVPIESEKADFVIYNTCTVRENANQKVYGRLGLLKKIKEKNPNMLIALCGCMMQESMAVEKIRKSYRHVDILFGTHNLYKLPELIYDRLESGSMIIDIWKDSDQMVEDLPQKRKYSFKCGINIMYGCNNFCSYCIVPYVRGRERSRKPQDILDEIQRDVKDGVVEVMLLGQNVNSYGKTLEDPLTFAQLLRQVEQIDGLKRIRFMTSHPKDLSDELIEVLGCSEKICPHLHLPLQSGSSKILKAMNRRYTKEDYLRLVDKIRTARPDISLTTDIMIGFPGETEEDFQETMDVVERVRFDNAFTFIYSKRNGTPAASMPDQVQEEVVKDRFGRLLSRVQEIAAQECGRLQGQVEEVLVEQVDEKAQGLVTGRIANNTIVHFPGDASLIGQFVPVRLQECKGFYYMGEACAKGESEHG